MRFSFYLNIECLNINDIVVVYDPAQLKNIDSACK